MIFWGDPASGRFGTGGEGELSFEPLTPPLAGGEQGGRVTGEGVEALGTRREDPVVPEGAALVRHVSTWLGDERFVSVRAIRPGGVEGHEAEEVEAWLVTPDQPEPVRVDEARISTTYDAAGRPLRAALELWLTPDSPYPLRLGGTRLGDGAFAWALDGARGVGRYDLVRP